MKKKLVEIIVQIIPVMIGVYLGFLVSDWADARTMQQKSKVLLENIAIEIKTNKGKILEVRDYHFMLRDSARVYADSETLTDKPRSFGGVRMPSLSNSAYQTGNQTGIINELPIEKIQSLNELYTLQQSYDEMGKMILSSMINMDFARNQESMKKISRFLSMTMTDVVIQESDLLEGYARVIEGLKK